MKINHINNINFGNQLQKNKTTPKTQGKLYTKQEALDILLDKYINIKNQIDFYYKESDGYFESVPDKEFERPKDNPILDGLIKYIPIIRETKIRKAYIEDAIAKVSRLPDGVKFQLDLGSHK